jgi:hypothetical protein
VAGEFRYQDGSLSERTRFVTQVCRSVCAESFSSARAATLRKTRSTARADSRRP